MAKVIGHVMKDAGHVDHVHYRDDDPTQTGLGQVVTVGGVVVDDPTVLPAGAGQQAVVTAVAAKDELYAVLDCGHLVLVDEPVPHSDRDALLASLPDTLPAKARQTVADALPTTDLPCGECA